MMRSVTSSISPSPSTCTSRPAARVERGERSRRGGVDLEAGADHVFGVVSAALDLRALEKALGDHVEVGRELDRHVEVRAKRREHRVELYRLLRLARVTVEQEASRSVGLCEAIAQPWRWSPNPGPTGPRS